jgi:hypothetical protein
MQSRLVVTAPSFKLDHSLPLKRTTDIKTDQYRIPKDAGIGKKF